MTIRGRAYKCQCHKTYFFDSSLTLVQNKLERFTLKKFKNLSWSLVVSRPKGWPYQGALWYTQMISHLRDSKEHVRPLGSAYCVIGPVCNRLRRVCMSA